MTIPNSQGHFPSPRRRRCRGRVVAIVVAGLALTVGASARAGERASLAPSRSATLSFSPELANISGCGTTGVQVTVDDATGVQGFDLRVKYPPELLKVVGTVKAGSLVRSCSFLANSAIPGAVIVSISCLQGPAGGGSLVDITFEGKANGGSSGNLQLPTNECMLQEGAVGCLSVPGSIVVSGCGSPTDCPADCDGSGVVEIDEIVAGSDIVLGRAAVDSCPAFGCDGHPDVGCLVQAVDTALSGCPQQP